MQFLIILIDMIFKQLFDDKSSTYTYILASDKGREALIIDPVIEHTNKYLNVLDELDLKLVKVIDTHIHADHVTGLNELSKKTNCTKIMGEKSKSEVIDMKVKENDKIKIEGNKQINALINHLAYKKLKWERSRQIDISDIYKN